MTTLRITSGLAGGDVEIGGHKHACVPILAAAAVAATRVIVENVPAIEDPRVIVEILERCGARAEWRDDELELDTTDLRAPVIPPELSERIHGAMYLVPAYLGRLGTVRFDSFGGCRIGDADAGGERPISHVFDVLERFGARFGDGVGHATRLTGTTIDIREYSTTPDAWTGPFISGATKTALLAAATADGATTVRNPFAKGETWELLTFLRACGHAIDASLEHITVEPVAAPAPLVRHRMTSDLGEILTYLIIGLVLDVPVRVQGRQLEAAERGLGPELAILDAMGVEVTWTGDTVQAQAPHGLRAVDIEVTHDSIYSDHQPLFALLLLHADRPSTIVDRVWVNRYGYAHELAKLGADMAVDGNTLHINPSRLHAPTEPLIAGDVRAAAVLVLAALAATGSTTIQGVEHLDRGYGDLPGGLRRLGAYVEQVEPACP